MPKKTNLSEKITNSISAATKLVRTRMNSNPKIDKKPIAKKSGPSMVSRMKKLINNPIIQTIGLNILEFNMQNNLSIYSHNICWIESKINHIRISEKIQTLRPDIFCLQEVVFQTQSEIFNLPHYHKSIAQDSGKRIVKGGLAIYSKVKPICIDFIKFEKQGKIFSPQLAERQLEKGFLVAEFDDYLIINTHLVADPSKKWTESKLKYTIAQFDQLLEFTKLTGNIKPIFIIGDMNFTPKNDSYKKAIGLGLIDITPKLPYTYIGKKTKLDYIWSTKLVSSFESRTIRFTHQEPSDHLAVYSKIAY
jgi:Endonuclease/Exonuclease/phosphatase family